MIIKFYQKNCVPCGMLENVMKELSLSPDESIEVTPDNIEEIKEKYDIHSTPTLVKLDENGSEMKRLSSVGMSKVSKFFKER